MGISDREKRDRSLRVREREGGEREREMEMEIEAAQFQASVAAEEEVGVALAERWREIQGLHHWKGLLQPLDLELRRNIIRYGEFNQAIYDAFDSETRSKYVGSCRYSKQDLFGKVGLQAEDGEDSWGYEVSRYLYATATSHILGRFFLSSHSKEAWSKESNWIGYVAVATDKGKEWLGRRDIVVVWRGTLRLFEWIDDFHAQQSNAADYLSSPDDDHHDEKHWYDALCKMTGDGQKEGLFDFNKHDVADLLPPQAEREAEHHWYDKLLKRGQPKPQVEKGWLLIYTSSDAKSPYTQDSARHQVLNELKYQLKKYEDEEVSITVIGHSLGASLAVLNAYDIAESGLNLREGREAVPVTAMVFGCPLVGDAAFKKRCEELEGLRILRVKNKKDLIALYPPTLMGYREVGEELLVDHRKSPFVNQKSRTIGDWHNLEAHLHLVAGTRGPDLPFQLAVDRDPALVNKSCDFLNAQLHIPASWWQPLTFKGLVKQPPWHWPDRPVPQPESMRAL